MPCHVVSCRVVSCRVVSCHVMSCHITSYMTYGTMLRYTILHPIRAASQASVARSVLLWSCSVLFWSRSGHVLCSGLVLIMCSVLFSFRLGSGLIPVMRTRPGQDQNRRYHIISYHIISYHIIHSIAYHIISYHVI